MLKKHYASYMLFCLVFEKVQNHLQATAECPATTKTYFRMQLSLFNVFSLLKTERGSAQKIPN